MAGTPVAILDNVHVSLGEEDGTGILPPEPSECPATFLPSAGKIS